MGVDASTQKVREQMAVRPWEVITRSEEFQAIADNALEGLGPILASWEALAKSEEFKVFLETAVLSLEPIIGAWGELAQSPEFKALAANGVDGVQIAVKAATSIFTSPELKDLRGDWLSLGRDVTLRVLKQAWGPMVQGIAAAFTEPSNQMQERGHLRTAG